MGLFTTQQAPLSSSTLAAGATKSRILAIRSEGKTSTLVSNVLSSHQDQINQLASVLRNPLPPISDLAITDSNGVLIGWIGSQLVGNTNYEGAWFANLWIGGSGPPTAIITINGATASITINDNGSIEILDPSNAIVAELGTVKDTPISISTISNTTPPIVTTSGAHGYLPGQSVMIAGNTVTAYNANWIIEVTGTNTFSLIGGTASGAGTGGTSTRYLSGVYAQFSAFGGTTPWNANININSEGLFSTGNGVLTTLSNQNIAGFGVAGLTLQDISDIGFGQFGVSGMICGDTSGNKVRASPIIVSLLDGTGVNFSELTTTALRVGAVSGSPFLSYSTGTLTIGGLNSSELAGGTLSFNGTQVLSLQQPAIAAVTGTAGATYTSVEQGIINTLVTQFNTLLTELATHGLIA